MMFKLTGFFVLALALLASRASAYSPIPFVGCSDDGVNGASSPPTGKPIVLNVQQEIASKLAIYTNGSLAVLAPRGWSCTSDSFNSSEELFVFKDKKYPNGPAVTVEENGVDDSPKWANYFPKIYPGDQDVLAPQYPSDKVTSYSPNVIEFTTPPRHDGLGFNFWGSCGAFPDDACTPAPALPSYGLLAVRAEQDTGDYILSVRLQPKAEFLRQTIMRFFARCLNGRANVECESGGAFLAGGSFTPN